METTQNEPATIREILRGERPWRVPVPIEIGQRVLHGEDLTGLSIDEILEMVQEKGRPKRKGQAFDLQIVASTADLVRDNGIVPMAAWDLEHFIENPVILFAHMGFIPPIGRSIDTFKRTGAGHLVEFWLFNDITEVGREVHALFELGDMRAASVGFMVRSFHRPDEDELKKLLKKFPRANPFTFIVDEAELVETSAVPVPADPGALVVEGRSIEDDLADIYDELGIRGPDDGQMFTFGSLPGRTANADQFPEVRQYWDAAKRYLAAECDRGNQAACNCLPREGHVTTPNDPNAEPEERTAIPFSVHAAGSYGVAPRGATWDGPGEVAKMSNDSAQLRRRHAWREAGGDADAKGTYKFPHHRAASNAPVVFRALAAGFARLNQAKIPDSERDGVAAHLGRHMRVDFDAEPPERCQVSELVEALIEIVKANPDDAGAVYRLALDLAIEHDETLLRLGQGDGGAGFDIVLAEAQFQAGIGPDPLLGEERDGDDDEIEIVTFMDLEVEIEETEGTEGTDG